MASNPTVQLELASLADPADEPPPVETSRRARKREPGPWRWRLRLAALIAGILVAVLAMLWGFYQVDQFLATYPRFVLPANAYSRPNPYFRVEGAVYVSRDDVAQVFAQDFGRSVQLVPLDERRRALLAIDWVREASVARRWPNRLAVRIAERTPVAFVALAPTAASGKAAQLPHELALIDADGVILRTPPYGDFPLPVLFGLTRNQELEARRERVGLMVNLLEELADFTNRISEVDVTDPENLKIMLNLDGRAVRLLLGQPPYLDKLKNFVRHYPEISRRLPNAVMFDLRLENRITAMEGTGHGR